MDYKTYLARVVELTRRIGNAETRSSYPSGIAGAALRALFDNLESSAASRAPAVRQTESDQDEEPSGDATGARAATAVLVDRAIRRVKKADWRGNRMKEREVRHAISSVVGDDADLVDRIFEIVKAQRDY